MEDRKNKTQKGTEHQKGRNQVQVWGASLRGTAGTGLEKDRVLRKSPVASGSQIGLGPGLGMLSR